MTTVPMPAWFRDAVHAARHQHHERHPGLTTPDQPHQPTGDDMTDDYLDRVATAPSMMDLYEGDVDSLVTEAREHRAAIERVRAVLTRWDTTFPEDGWGTLLQDVADALDGTSQNEPATHLAFVNPATGTSHWLRTGAPEDGPGTAV